MKKIIIAVALIAVVGGACWMMKDRLGGMQLFGSRATDGADLTIMNDSSDTISVEYKDDGKNVALILPVNEKISGGKGFIRIFTAKKAGSYELTYPFPRGMGATQQVSFSQIVAAAKKEGMTDEEYTQKGMLGDIAVVYEQVRELDVTY